SPPALSGKPSGGMYALPYLGAAACDLRGNLRQDEWWEILFFIWRLEPQEQQEVIRQSLEDECSLGERALMLLPVSVDVAQKVLGLLGDRCFGSTLSDLHSSHVYGKPAASLSKKPKNEDLHKEVKPAAECSAEPSDLQLLSSLLSQEGVHHPPADDRCKGFGAPQGTSQGFSLDMLLGFLEKVKRTSCGVEALNSAVQVMLQQSEEEIHTVKSEGRSNREKIIKTLVEILSSQMKEKLVVVSCLQLTYVVLSKYDWRVLFATEGGVRAVLGCMQEHQSSLAIQHIGLAVLKVLTGVGGCDLRGSARRYNLNPGDAQMMKEIFSSIGSAASGSSTSLLRAIPGAICKLQGKEGCFTAVYNGLLVIRMLTENHEALSEQLSRGELPAVLQSVTGDSNSMFSRLDIFLKKQLCDLLKSSQEKSLTDTEALTDTDFFLQLLSVLEQLRSEKQLQLCVYRILYKSLSFYQEDALPWHRSIEPCLTSLIPGKQLFSLVKRYLCVTSLLDS
ncbi:unnamed protein product, partial [Ranitomeya imitator]